MSDTSYLPEIEVTPAMIEAGLDELRECRLGGDLKKIVREVYVAMEYTRMDGEQAVRRLSEGVMSWRPIETIEWNGAQTRFRFRNGRTAIAPAVEPKPLSKAQNVKLYKEFGEWPDAGWTITEWMPLDEPQKSKPALA